MVRTWLRIGSEIGAGLEDDLPAPLTHLPLSAAQQRIPENPAVFKQSPQRPARRLSFRPTRNILRRSRSHRPPAPGPIPLPTVSTLVHCSKTRTMTSPPPPPPPGDYSEAPDAEMAVGGEEERNVWSQGTFPPRLSSTSSLGSHTRLRAGLERSRPPGS